MNLDYLRARQYAKQSGSSAVAPVPVKTLYPGKAAVAPTPVQAAVPAPQQSSRAGATARRSSSRAGATQTLLAPEPPIPIPPGNPPAAEVFTSPPARLTPARRGISATEKGTSDPDREAMLDIGLMPIENVDKVPETEVSEG